MELSRSKIKRSRAMALLMISLLLLAGSAGAQKFQLSIFGEISHVFQYGSEENYVLGENDFPATSSHTPSSVGASIAYFFTGKLDLEADGWYVFSSKVTLVDPSDQDMVTVDTAKHFSLSLNLNCHFSLGSFKLYLVAGGGYDSVSGEEKNYVSEYGFEIIVEATESETDALADFGTGLSVPSTIDLAFAWMSGMS